LSDRPIESVEDRRGEQPMRAERLGHLRSGGLRHRHHRSVMRPGAMNQGAIAIRRAPARRSRPIPSRTDGCGPVAKATSLPAHPLPAASAPATVAVRALAAA